MVKLKIEKLVEGGQGLAQDGEKVYFVWNALPGEDVEAEILNKRKGVYECLAINILKPSPNRIAPAEKHFLSCSPWSIMDPQYEGEMKCAVVSETYKRIGKLNIDSGVEIATDDINSGYRNKMEFSFIEDQGKISFAFFKRAQRTRSPIDGCVLATNAINDTAKKILDWINTTELTMRNMKALVIRSNQKGETITGLFIKDKMNFEKYPGLDDKFLGFNLYYSTHKSPASVITEVLYQEGQDFLVEEIKIKKTRKQENKKAKDSNVEKIMHFKYGINSFFQVNIPVFEMALNDIRKFVLKEKNIVDFYSGVGTIGLCVGANQLVELNEEAVTFAQENIKLNGIGNCEASLSPAEKALEYIEKGRTIIFDPPRAGLHGKVIDRILEVLPKKIIYLSCNVATQARDIWLLQEKYNITFTKIYNFFPRTPHIEALMVLELKK